MRYLLPFTAVLIAIVMSGCGSKSIDNATAQKLHELDAVIDSTSAYDAGRLARIDQLRKHIAEAPARSMRRYELNNDIFDLFESMQYDSAMHYLNLNISLAEELDRPDLKGHTEVKLAQVVSKAGLFPEALWILDNVNVALLDSTSRTEYYQAYSDLYQYLIEYEGDHTFSPKYRNLKKLYTDSMLMYADPMSFESISMRGTKLIESGDHQGGIDYLKDFLAKYPSGSREYSVLSSVIAFAYRQLGNENEALNHYIEAAMSDIRGSVKENMALRAIGEEMYNREQITRANDYLSKSIEDANYFNARMRSNQSSYLLPLVASSYQAQQDNQRHTLSWMLAVMVILAIGMLVACVFAWRQLKAVRASHRIVSRTSEELRGLNNDLQKAVEAYDTANRSLSEANKIKEEYLGKFLELCSNYISALEQYRRMLSQKAATGKVDDLLRTLKSQKVINDSLTDFFVAFDTAFLNIYPTFVERFNALLTPDGKSATRSGEKLNTEMRIFALIRLGITDSGKISDFLRCSITTIYTYRSKVKNRAINPESFEADVLKIQ